MGLDDQLRAQANPGTLGIRLRPRSSYRPKYQSDESAVDPLIEAAASFVRSWSAEFESIVPVPPTKTYRKFQPVLKLAMALGRRIGRPVLRNAVARSKRRRN
jgi:predicted amidophosphoribosyltransferase